jgi:hypothetical protein
LRPVDWRATGRALALWSPFARAKLPPTIR